MKTVNIGIVAHVDAGKTTLTEQLLYCSGQTRTVGSVDDGTSQSDFLKVEQRRGISVRTSVVSLQYGDVRINVIDTPGHADFAADVERSLAVLDVAVVMISAVEGIQPQTELLIEALMRTNTRMIFVINKVDRAGSRIQKIIDEIRERFSLRTICLTDVKQEGERDCILTDRTLKSDDFFTEATELLCETSDELMERYLSGEEISKEEIHRLMTAAFSSGELVPVLCMAALHGKGIASLLSLLAACDFSYKNRQDDTLSGIVYQVTHDKAMGRVAHVRLFGGALKNRDSVQLTDGSEQKITQIRRYQGGKFSDIGEVRRGEIGALCGLSNIRAGDIIGELFELQQYELSAPLFCVQAAPKTASERYALLQALLELSAEDPGMRVSYEQGEQEIDVNVTGKIQLEVINELLQTRYGLSCTFSAPSVIYRETPIKPGRGHEAYTMPKPCWAIVTLDITPLPRGSGITFSSTVPNNQMFYRYQRHVETALYRAAKQGLYNWEVVDMNVVLSDGNHHTIHTHPMDFFLATPLALYDGLLHTGTHLLEPMQKMRIAVPEEYAKTVLGDLITLRAQADVPVIKNGMFFVEARVPAATVMDYSVTLAAKTKGKGSLSLRFDGYEICPPGIGAATRHRGPDPRDRDRYILTMRSAMA